jgi:adenylate cyclase class 2
MSAATPVETEIKLPFTDPEAIAGRIRAAGFTIHRERIFEGNNVYDTPSATIREKGELLRMREAGGVATLTWKGPTLTTGGHKSRPEVETTVADAAALDTILRRLGYVPVFRYEKFRTEFAKAGEEGLITLDETPIGWFLELEGPPAWIDATAASLGFDKSQYITASYGSLYLDFCRREDRQPGWMVFPT